MHFIHDRIDDCIFSYARDCINPNLGYPFDHSSILSENLPSPDSSHGQNLKFWLQKCWQKTTNTGQRLQIPWLWETINFHGRKAKFSVRALKKSSRSRVINKSLHKLRGLVKLPEYMTQMFDNLRLTDCFLTWLILLNMLSLTCCVTSNWLWEIKKWVQVMTLYTNKQQELLEGLVGTSYRVQTILGAHHNLECFVEVRKFNQRYFKCWVLKLIGNFRSYTHLINLPIQLLFRTPECFEYKSLTEYPIRLAICG